jgi:glycosyltransferase involved in cell wall biosynthesis
MADDIDQPIQPLNVLLVVDDDIFDRLGSVVRHLCLGMMDEPVRLTVMARSDRKVEEHVGPCRLVYLPKRPWFRSRRWIDPDAALEMIGGEEPEIVHCLSADLARLVRDWAFDWASDLVVHLTDLVDVARFSRLCRHQGRRRAVPSQADMTAIAATSSIHKALLTRRPHLADRARVIPLGMPADAEPACFARFATAIRTNPAGPGEQAAGGPERVPAALLTTPLTRDCGLHLVLKAMEGVVKGGQEVHLFVLSSGPGEPMFRRLVAQLGLRSCVTFAGDLHDWNALREAMRGADFYILPGERRRFTISTLSAMASGLAILAPTGTIGDYLIDGVTASLFDPQHPRQLGERWAGLLADRAAARQLASGALDYIRMNHQGSAMVSAVAGLYRELGGEGE